MLVSFRVKNFKSIVDATLDLRYGEGKAPNGYAEMDRMPFLQAAMGESVPKNTRPLRVVPVLAIYGQNAGGKSTIVEAMKTFWVFMCRFPLAPQTEKLLFQPNILHPELKATEYTIESLIKGKLFRYSVAYTRETVVREELRQGDKTLYLIDREKGIVELGALANDDYPVKRIQKIIDVECTSAEGHQRRALFPKIGCGYAGLHWDAAIFFDEISEMSLLSDNHIDPDVALQTLHLQIGDEAGEAAFREIEGYMTKLDIGIARMELSPEVQESLRRYLKEDFMFGESNSFDTPPKSAADSIYTYHRRTDGELVPLRLRDESRGSQVLFGLLGVLLAALHSGGTVVIDELDRSIHPLVLKSLVSLFTDKTYNKHNAQLIFTAHNTELLDGDELRLSEVGIVTKTAQDGTQLRRLCDFEGVRNVKNFRLGYLDGYFSGIPFPSI